MGIVLVLGCHMLLFLARNWLLFSSSGDTWGSLGQWFRLLVEEPPTRGQEIHLILVSGQHHTESSSPVSLYPVERKKIMQQCFIYYDDAVSCRAHYSQCWPWTLDLPSYTSSVLGSQACTTTMLASLLWSTAKYKPGEAHKKELFSQVAEHMKHLETSRFLKDRLPPPF